MSEKSRLMVGALRRLGALSPMGYSVGLHIRFASPLYLRSTYPKAWREAYVANVYSLRDPLVFWGVSRTGQTRWSEIALPDPFGVLAQAASHGLTYGAVVSCGIITSRTIIGSGRADREFADDEITEIAEIAGILHELAEPPDRLPAPEAEALRLAARGLTETEAAAEIGIPLAALRERLAGARRKLGARTTGEATRLAKGYRLI